MESKKYMKDNKIIDEEKKNQICTCCVMDTTDTALVFDENGVCQRCNEFKTRILPDWNYGQGHEEELAILIADIKKKGKNKPYDCILGLSGGLDSTYLLHLAVKEWGLKPFVFHIDAGWNLPVAEENIKKVTDKLGIELHVEKMDWDEMREMQLAWFRSGLNCLDAPQDHAFIAVIDKYSRKLGVKYIFNGYNIATEIVADPDSWGSKYHTGDKVFMKDVVKKYCRIPIKHYTFTSGFKHKFSNPYIHHIKTVKPLNLVPITRQQMIDTLSKEYGYVPYGQKHFEDLITKFIEGYWDYHKHGHDIRKAQLSSLVITGQMSRDDALKILEKPPLSKEEEQQLFEMVANKLEISKEELQSYYDLPECTEKFKNRNKSYEFGIRLFEKLGLEKRIRK